MTVVLLGESRSLYPWKDSQEHIDEVVEHARRFLKSHARVTVSA